MEAFDMETFISEVEARPVLWDCRTGLYLDREKRAQAWNELCIKFVPNFAEKSVQEKNHAATHIQRRWKSLRDCFKREYTKQMKEQKENNAGATVRKPYKYYHNLSFLISVTEPRGDVTVPLVVDERDPSDYAADKAKRKRKSLYPMGDIGEPETELLQGFSDQFGGEDEADRNFALSLLPHLRLVPVEHKLDVQVEILMVLKKFGKQAHDCCPERASRNQGTAAQEKLSPESMEDGQGLSDDSSINENLYY